MATVAHVLVFDAAGSPSLAAMFRREFGAGVVTEDPTTRATGPAAAVGVFPAGSIGHVCSFLTQQLQQGTPTLIAISAADASWAGPWTVPGRAGCWNCAHERMLAANAAEGRAAPDRAGDLQCAPLLIREIRSAMRRGPAKSMLLDHVMECPSGGGDPVLHRVVPLPHCRVCGGAAAHRRTGVAELPGVDDPEALLTALAGWVDNRTGVISRVVLNATRPVFVATAAPPHVIDNGSAPRRLAVGWGKGLTVSNAILSAVGEAVERYSASMPDPARLLWKRLADLDGDVLDPRSLPLYSDEQYNRTAFPFVRFDPDAVHPWVRGWWLDTHEPVWTPAVLAYLALDVRHDNLFCQGSSNGLACSTSLEDAARRATLELIERDAFFAAWLTGTAGVRVEAPLPHGIAEYMESLGARVEAYLLPTAARGSAALCLALGDGVEYPGATIALGCDPDPCSAVLQAALELAQTGPHLRSLMRSGALAVPAEPSDVREMLDHAAYFFPRERAAAFDPLRSIAPPATRTDASIRIAIVDVTSPDVATGPFRVARAISPDLQPVTFGHGLDRQPVKRLRDLGISREVSPVHPIW